jgi:hypothetical protein
MGVGFFQKIISIFILLWFLIPFQGCGQDVVWFVAWNGGLVGTEGIIVVVGTPRDPPPEDVVLVDGEIPEGMEIMPDGTVQGVPKEIGTFEFTLEFTNPDGSVEEESFQVEVEE